MNPKVTEIIDGFENPVKEILVHLRQLIHEVDSEIEEAVKWRAPSFEKNGKIAIAMMGFKNHVNFIMREGGSINDPKKIFEDIGDKSGMVGIKGIKNVHELPKPEVLKSLIRQSPILDL
jgi:hypothetical protein